MYHGMVMCLIDWAQIVRHRAPWLSWHEFSTWSFKEFVMKTKTGSSRSRAQDRAKVAGGQDYEVKYEANKLGTSSQKVKKAVKSAGNSRKKVEKAVKG